MAVTVENGSVVADADSYVSRADYIEDGGAFSNAATNLATVQGAFA